MIWPIRFHRDFLQKKNKIIIIKFSTKNWQNILWFWTKEKGGSRRGCNNIKVCVYGFKMGPSSSMFLLTCCSVWVISLHREQFFPHKQHIFWAYYYIVNKNNFQTGKYILYNLQSYTPWVKKLASFATNLVHFRYVLCSEKLPSLKIISDLGLHLK